MELKMTAGEKLNDGLKKALLETEPINFMTDSEHSLLKSLIHRKQTEYRNEAILLGKKLFALDPDDLIHWIGEAWKSEAKEGPF